MLHGMVRLAGVFGLVVLICPVARSATITFTPTDLNGNRRLDGSAQIVRAVDQNNRAVNANETIRRQANGDVTVQIDNPNVKAFSVVISAGGALDANMENVLAVNPQTITVALPNADQAEYIPSVVYDAHPRCVVYDRCRLSLLGQRRFGRK